MLNTSTEKKLYYRNLQSNYINTKVIVFQKLICAIILGLFTSTLYDGVNLYDGMSTLVTTLEAHILSAHLPTLF